MIQKDLWLDLKLESKKLETSMNKMQRKRTGSYYTHLDLTDNMMEDLVKELKSDKKDICKMTYFEPCVGTGNFVFSYLKQIDKLKYSKKQIEELINNIYVADINNDALEFYKTKLTNFVNKTWEIQLNNDYFESHIGTGLLLDVMSNSIRYIKYQDVFKDTKLSNGFDIIATNPPYKNLKAELSQYTNKDEFNIDKSRYAKILGIVNKQFCLSNKGVLNLYKLFVEEIITKYAKETSYISLLIPTTILSDKTCCELRKYIIDNYDLRIVKNIKEHNKFIDASQSISTLMMKSPGESNSIKLVNDYVDSPDEIKIITKKDIIKYNKNFEIISISNIESKIIDKLLKYPKVKNMNFIHNLRGELDLTTNMQYVCESKTDYHLLRGRNISNYRILNTKNNDYVKEEFISKTNKRNFIKSERIACQQISNINKSKRVVFAPVPKNNVLGNSCNFIAVDKNDNGIDIYTLMALFNSNIINWYFKLKSSNNHINNYEIDEFPVLIDETINNELRNICKEYLKTYDNKLLIDIDTKVLDSFEISKKEVAGLW